MLHKISRLAMEKVACFIVFLALLPLLLFSSFISFFYRKAVDGFYKVKGGERYKGLLGGPDVLWAMDRPEARSIITVLVLLDVLPVVRGATPKETVLDLLKDIAYKAFLSPLSEFTKLSYLRRRSRLGFYYWIKDPDINIDSFVRQFDIKYDSSKPPEETLREIIGFQCNEPLPYDDTASWEILVGQEPFQADDGANDQIPVIFRIHHTVGDGVALTRLLLEGLADCGETKSLLSEKRKIWATSNDRIFLAKDSPLTISRLWNSDENTHHLVLKKIEQLSYSLLLLGKNWIDSILRAFYIFTSCAYVMKKQMLGGTDDCVLYGKKLTGRKVVSWITETESDGTAFLSRFRDLKKRHIASSGRSIKLTHILLTCLSRSLNNFYTRRGTIPRSVNIVWPARVDLDDLSQGFQSTAKIKMGPIRTRITRLHGTRVLRKPEFRSGQMSFSTSIETQLDQIEENLKILHNLLSQPQIQRPNILMNKFTVAMMNLPIAAAEDDLFSVIQKECDRLQASSDYLVNYWLLRWVAHLFPIPLLKPILSNVPCTMVLSNLPGPESVVCLAKMPIKNIVFWLPNRGMTGLGLGILSYCGRFSVGISADETLMSQEEVNRLVSDLLTELKLATDNYV